MRLMWSAGLKRFAKAVVTIQLQEPGPRGRQGNATWVSKGEPITVKGIMNLASTREITQGRETTIDNWLLILPAGTPIEASSRVFVGGREYEVEANPETIILGVGKHHIEARLRLVKDLGDA